MRAANKDWLFLAVIAAIVGALLVSTGKVKAKNVPYDEKHRRFYEAMRTGGDRIEVEKGCAACHSVTATPLSGAHPPKEQCLVCHQLSQDRK